LAIRMVGAVILVTLKILQVCVYVVCFPFCGFSGGGWLATPRGVGRTTNAPPPPPPPLSIIF